jgi:hypothetical protein
MHDDSHDRLDHFMDAYNLVSTQRKMIRSRVYDGGLHPDDPMAILVAQDGIMQERLVTVLAVLREQPKQMERSTANLAAKISGTVTKDIDRRNATFLDGLTDRVSANLDLAIRQSMSKADVRFFQRAALHAALGCLLTAGLAGTTGYALGRHDTQNIASGYSNVIARPDARTWLTLIEKNGSIDTILHENCYNAGPAHLPQLADGDACAVPLWIGEGDFSGTDAITPYFKAIFKSVPSWLTAWVLVTAGLLIGGCVGATSKRAFRQTRQEDAG